MVAVAPPSRLALASGESIASHWRTKAEVRAWCWLGFGLGVEVGVRVRVRVRVRDVLRAWPCM